MGPIGSFTRFTVGFLTFIAASFVLTSIAAHQLETEQKAAAAAAAIEAMVVHSR